MPLFSKNKEKIFFIHVPKTGGTSIKKIFLSNEYSVSIHEYSSNGFNPLTDKNKYPAALQHIHAEIIKEEVDVSNVNYFFAFYRDPIERLISEYNYRKPGMKFESWIDYIFGKYEKDPWMLSNHIRPQTDFYFDKCDVYNFDNISKFPEKLFSRTGIKIKADVPHENKSIKQKTSTQISKSVESKIKNFYKKDYSWLKQNILI